MTAAYVGLGSNLGDRLGALRAAVAALAGLPRTRVVARSGVYEAEAHVRSGQPAQPDHLNAAVGLATRLEAPALLAHLHAIERALGRRPAPAWSPRPLDLDLVLYGDEQRAEAALVLPHPRLAERRFVLAPLAEIAPARAVPGLGATVAEMLAVCPDRARLVRTPFRL